MKQELRILESTIELIDKLGFLESGLTDPWSEFGIFVRTVANKLADWWEYSWIEVDNEFGNK